MFSLQLALPLQYTRTMSCTPHIDERSTLYVASISRGVKGHATICTRGGREPGNRGYIVCTLVREAKCMYIVYVHW